MTLTLVAKTLEVVVLPLLAVVLPFLLHRYLRAKTLRDVTGQVLDLALGKAEEWARKRAASGAKPTGSEKLAHAVSFALDLLAEHKLPQLGADKIGDLLEAKLGTRR